MHTQLGLDVAGLGHIGRCSHCLGRGEARLTGQCQECKGRTRSPPHKVGTPAGELHPTGVTQASGFLTSPPWRHCTDLRPTLHTTLTCWETSSKSLNLSEPWPRNGNNSTNLTGLSQGRAQPRAQKNSKFSHTQYALCKPNCESPGFLKTKSSF